MQRIPILAGPTASGKSSLALELVERFPLDIVSADAMMVYRGMDIGTAKPSPAERARVPHHLIDIADPDEPFSVADWVARAEEAIGEILARGRVPLVVGGTGFYLRALSEGLPTVPPADERVQAELWKRLEQEGLDSLVRELDRVSPEDAQRAQRNPRRVVRALEVIQRTGRAPSSFGRTEPEYRYQNLILLPEMNLLEPRIHARTKAMFASGLVAEVTRLLERYPERPTAVQAIGYKEVTAFLGGEAPLEEAKGAVTRATLRYAKRQRTWFRKERNAEYFFVTAEEARDPVTQRLHTLLKPQRDDHSTDY